MEHQLSFEFVLSLKEISLKRVVINLWSERDILASIEKLSSTDYSEKWRQTVECKVTDKLSKLVIPKSIAEQALLIVTPIGLEIKRWKLFHEQYLMAGWSEFHKKFSLNSHINFDAPILSKLRWTSSGTVDYGKTAEELVHSEMLGILTCYQLACLYCLEDTIPSLWEELPKEIKKTFYSKNCTSQIEGIDLQFCWPYILKGEHSKLDCIIKRKYAKNMSFNQVAFEISAHRANKVATEYFFQKLTHKERKASLNATVSLVSIVRLCARLNPSVDSFPLENFSKVFFYLISLMSHKERMKFFQSSPGEFFIFCLDSLRHDIFLKIADLTWTFLPSKSYCKLLKKLSDYFREQQHYLPFLKLFQEFFISSPIRFRKKFVARECELGDFFPRLFDYQDLETIKVIFRSVDTADRARLVSGKPIFKLFFHFILKGKLDIVILCLREAKLSNEDRKRLINNFFTFRIKGRQSNNTYRSIRNQFLKLMDDIYCNSQSKRVSEDDARNKAKKLCSCEKENFANELK